MVAFVAPVDFGILAGAGATTRSFKAGEIIFRVEIRLGNRVLDTVPESSVFGAMALVDPAPRSATAVALTDVTIVPVAEKQFLFLVSRTPHFALNVMRVLARRLRATNVAI